MTDENKPKTFKWRAPNLSRTSYGRPMDPDMSRTVPKAKQEKWDLKIEIDKSKVKVGKDKTCKDEKLVTSSTESQHAAKSMRERQSIERKAEQKKPVMGPIYAPHIGDHYKKMERNAGVNRVTVAMPGGNIVGGTVEELEAIHVPKSVMGQKVNKVARGKEERTEKFLDKRGEQTPLRDPDKSGKIK